jgi:hypothetical protein
LESRTLVSMSRVRRVTDAGPCPPELVGSLTGGLPQTLVIALARLRQILGTGPPSYSHPAVAPVVIGGLVLLGASTG